MGLSVVEDLINQVHYTQIRLIEIELPFHFSDQNQFHQNQFDQYQNCSFRIPSCSQEIHILYLNTTNRVFINKNFWAMKDWGPQINL